MKRCTKCDLLKPLSDFYARTTRCRDCARLYRQTYNRINATRLRENVKAYRLANLEWYRENQRQYRARPAAKRRARERETSLKRMVTRWWGSLNRRTVNGTHPLWDYKIHRKYLVRGIRLEITRDELVSLVTKNWPQITAMLANGEKPSIDRINPDGHYSLDNIQFISLKRNCGQVRHSKIKK